MVLVQQIAKLLRDVYSGGNWTDVNLKDTLAGVGWQEATIKVYGLNTIADLIFHLDYYLVQVLRVMQGAPLTGSHKFSFDTPSIFSEEDWQKLVVSAFSNSEALAAQIERFDEARLFDVFADPKYGNYYKNLHGIIEHAHYHLGQIVLLKKIIRETKAGGAKNDFLN